MTLMTETITITGYLQKFEAALREESQKMELLEPYMCEIRQALENQNYPEALKAIDELEALIDLEFC